MLMEIIHKDNPYDGFDRSRHPVDHQGWASQSPVFEHFISMLRPQKILEVGSWKGGSAIHMAELAKKHGIADFELCCVDTWLGSVEHWDIRDGYNFYDSLKLVNGYPSLYYTFMANVLESGHSDVIVPFPIASAAAARFFTRKNVMFDVIYVDAAHDYEEVMLDLALFWPLLKPGGVMIGDDFDANWHGVVRGVCEFAERVGKLFWKAGDQKWFIRK